METAKLKDTTDKGRNYKALYEELAIRLSEVRKFSQHLPPLSREILSRICFGR
jgi:hypothetical protein